MENQAINANDNLKKINSDIKKRVIWICGFSIHTAFNIVLAIGNFNLNPYILPYIGIGIGILSIALPSNSLFHDLAYKREIKKMNLFLDEKQDFNEALLNHKNKNLAKGISKKARIQLSKTPENPVGVININNLDNFSLSDLRILKSNIEKSKQLGFSYNYQDAGAMEKGQVKSKRPNSKQ